MTKRGTREHRIAEAISLLDARAFRVLWVALRDAALADRTVPLAVLLQLAVDELGLGGSEGTSGLGEIAIFGEAVEPDSQVSNVVIDVLLRLRETWWPKPVSRSAFVTEIVQELVQQGALQAADPLVTSLLEAARRQEPDAD